MTDESLRHILVTGANGFIGNAIRGLLRQRNYLVRGTVRSLGRATGPNSDDVIEIGDIDSATNWLHVLENIDAVIHLAARAHIIRETSNNPLLEFRKINVSGTEKLAQGAVRAKVKRFIYVSSIGVNGQCNNEDVPFTEIDSPNPHDPYTTSKWEAEQTLLKISKETNLEVVIIRCPLVYGPHVKGNFLRLMKIVERGLPLPFASVNNRRSLLYVENLTDLIIHCIESKNVASRTFLASDNEDISTPDLIRQLANAMGVKARLFSFNSRLLKSFAKAFGKTDEFNRLCGSLRVNSSKARRILNWQPPISVDEGIKRTVEWYLQKTQGVRRKA